MLRYFCSPGKHKEMFHETITLALAACDCALCPRCRSRKLRDTEHGGTPYHRHVVSFRLPWYGAGPLLPAERIYRAVVAGYRAQLYPRCACVRHTDVCREVVVPSNTNDIDRLLYGMCNNTGDGRISPTASRIIVPAHSSIQGGKPSMQIRRFSADLKSK